MRTLALTATAAVLALTLGACSREDSTQIKEGVQSATAEIKDAASTIKNDPDVKEAGAALKSAAKDAGSELKDTAQDAGRAAKSVGSDLKAGAQDLAAETRQAGREAGADIRKAGKEAKDEVDGDPKTS